MADYKLGGNCSGLRPVFTSTDEGFVVNGMSGLLPGDIARISSIFHEIFWIPGSPNYTGLDRALELAVARQLVPLVLINVSAFPSNPNWYNNFEHGDWYVINDRRFQLAMECTSLLVAHIRTKLASLGQTDCYYQIHNEPGKGKPGATVDSTYNSGTWHPKHHRQFFEVAKILKDIGVPRNRVVAPAFSYLQEGWAFGHEIVSCIPPRKWDWRKLCGYRCYHVRFSASYSAGNLTDYVGGITFNAIKSTLQIDELLKTGYPSDSKIMFTEAYVTPYDTGNSATPNIPMAPYKEAMLDALFTTIPNATMIPWGMTPGDYNHGNGMTGSDTALMFGGVDGWGTVIQNYPR